MQPLTKHRELSTGGVVATTAFTISMKDQAHIKSILRDTLYSDKIMAVLREYSANAWDAHRMSGKADKPIKVILPTWDEPTLVIQDWGTGLSHEEVFEVFARYGASTKREDNESVGMLGIGSKSGFAYSDTFTIISCHGGKKRTYVALLDESENDAINLLSEIDSIEEPGIAIQIAVKQEDIAEFERKARQLFQHFNPRPDINIDLPNPPAIKAKLKNGIIYDRLVDKWSDDDGKGRWYAIMGCVPYRINLDQLKDSNNEPLISENFKNTCGLLNFSIGEIQINASREDLKYSKITKDALVQKFNDLLDEYVMVVLDEIEKSTCSNWEKRVQAQVLLRLGLGKKEVGEWALDRVPVKEYKTFSVHNCENSHTSTIVVSGETRLLRYFSEKIGRKRLKGYGLTRYDYFIVPKFPVDVQGKIIDPPVKPTWDAINTELTQVLSADKNDGIKIENLHELSWLPKNGKVKAREFNPKHVVRTFQMVATHGRGREASENWEIAKRDPQDDDVFVILSHFETCNVAGQNFNLAHLRGLDEQIAESLGVTLPVIYGYKTTEKKPLTVAGLKGIHYPEWRKKFYAEARVASEKIAQFNIQAWFRVLPRRRIYDDNYDVDTLKPMEAVCRQLGWSHPIAIYLSNAIANKDAGTGNSDLWYAKERLEREGIKMPPMEATTQLETIEKTYPLLNSVDRLWSSSATEWLRYVRLIDIDLQAAMWQDSISTSLISTDDEAVVITPEKIEENP